MIPRSTEPMPNGKVQEPVTPPPSGPPAAPAASPSEPPPKTGYGPVLRNRLFLLIWAAQVLSQTAQNIINFAVVVEVERLTHSSANVSWVIVSFSLPAVLLGPLAGVFVDRTSKRGVMLWTNVLRALLMLGFLLSFLAAPLSLFAIYTATFAASAVSQFFSPAEGSMIPLLVGKYDILPATSLFQLTFTVSQVLGFVVLGPVFYKVFGSQALLIAVALVVGMYVVAAACIASIPQVERLAGTVWQALRRSLNVIHVWRDMLETRRFVGAAPGLTLAIAHLTLATALLMVLATLGPGFVSRVLGLPAEDTGYIIAPAGAGMLVATAALGHFAVHMNRKLLAGFGLLFAGIFLGALGFVRPIYDLTTSALHRTPTANAVAFTSSPLYVGLVLLITFFLGVMFALITIPAQTVVTEATEEHIRGRVFALLFMLTQTASALPVVVIGFLADRVGIVPVLVAIAATITVIGVGTLLGPEWRVWRRIPFWRRQRV